MAPGWEPVQEPHDRRPCDNWWIAGPYCTAVYQTFDRPEPVTHGQRPMTFDWVIAVLPFVLGGVGGYWAYKKWPENKVRVAAAVGGGVAIGVLSPFVPMLLLGGAMAAREGVTGRRPSF